VTVARGVHGARANAVLRGAALGVLAVASGLDAQPASQPAGSPPGRIEGTVFDSLRTRALLAGATVVLIEANRYATADARGRFRFDSVPEGRWSLTVLHPSLDTLDLQLPPVGVEVKARARVRVPLFTPSVDALYAALCGMARDADAGAIVGRVRDVATDEPLAHAVVRTEWTEFVLGGAGVTSRRAADSTRTNADGVYVLCDAPLQVALDLRLSLDAQRAGPVRVLIDDALIVRRNLALSRTDAAARDSTVRGTARVSGRVLAADRRPQPNAVVTVAGGADTVRTDEDGRFTIDGLASGSRTFEVRAIGADPRSIVMDLAPATTRDTVVELARSGRLLQKYVVRSTIPERSVMNMSGFEDRRRVGLGAFTTGPEIEKYNYPTLAAILQSMRGVSIEYDARGWPLPLLRGMAGGRCIPFFYVDNTPMKVEGASPGPAVQFPFSDIEAFVPPRTIKGIEVYASPGGIPPQYDQTALGGCGSIVIWTR
jgi:hypothetical protein